jgi:hypothetical protein
LAQFSHFSPGANDPGSPGILGVKGLRKLICDPATVGTASFFNLLLRRPFAPPSLSSRGVPVPVPVPVPFSFLESKLSVLIWRLSGLDVNPFVKGVDLRFEGRYSGVFLAEDNGLSTALLGGVKLLSGSLSRLA